MGCWFAALVRYSARAAAALGYFVRAEALQAFVKTSVACLPPAGSGSGTAVYLTSGACCAMNGIIQPPSTTMAEVFLLNASPHQPAPCSLNSSPLPSCLNPYHHWTALTPLS